MTSFFGLTQKKAEALLKDKGRNKIQEKKRPPIIFLFLGQFKDTLVLILILSIVASAVMGDYIEAFAILVVVLMNGCFGFLQEYKTEKTLEALKKLSAPFSRVIRDGQVRRILSEEIVVDDLVVLEAGDRVPADMVLLNAERYSCDESMLTGESDPVFKQGEFSGTAKKSKRDLIVRNKVKETKDDVIEIRRFQTYMGSMVLSGNGVGKVFATGMNTQMGKIAKMIDEVEVEENTLQKKLNYLGKIIATVCLLVCIAVVVIGVLRGENVFNMLLTGISLAVASIPESLPAVVMIALAVGVQRMLKKNALIKKLTAVETLGVTDVLCTDKTGTLTENRMNLKSVAFCQNEIDLFEGRSPKKSSELERFFQIAILNNNAQFTTTKKGESGFLGDSLECAFLKSAQEMGYAIAKMRDQYQRIVEIPFDSEKKYMGVVVKSEEGPQCLIKGAAELVMKHCRFVMLPDGIKEMNPARMNRILNYQEKATSKAYRVIAMAYKKLNGNEKISAENEEKWFKDFVFVGLAFITDPPRPEVPKAVKQINQAGIRTVMITGDHKNTAVAIAKQVGIWERGDEVLTGNELEVLDDEALKGKLDKVSVFARVNPSHKLKIVQLFKAKGLVVAMTGDGVNDAPAVKKADIGIAMGMNGTDVTREAASIVLLDDRFTSIAEAVKQGRIIYANIQKAIVYLLTCNVGEVVTMLAGSILGFPTVLLPVQILWVNLVTDGLPAIGLATDVPDEKSLLSASEKSSERPVRSEITGKNRRKIKKQGYNSQNIFYEGLFKEIFVRGFIKGMIVLGVFIFYSIHTGDTEVARTQAFFSMMIAQLLFAIECRGLKGRFLPFLSTVLVSFSLALIVLWVDVFRNAFGLTIPTLMDWVILLGVSLVFPVVKVIVKAIKRYFFQTNQISLQKSVISR